MKRLISFCFMVLCAMTLFAQKDVTTFLGIPVDGTYSAMRKKLIAKGFKPQRLGRDEYFSGRFNGEDVQLLSCQIIIKYGVSRYLRLYRERKHRSRYILIALLANLKVTNDMSP